jgi:hypothetical protein
MIVNYCSPRFGTAYYSLNFSDLLKRKAILLQRHKPPP